MDLEIYDKVKNVSLYEISFVRDIENFAARYLNLKDDVEMSITFVNDEEIKEINKRYRNVDRVTDVISFAIRDNNDLPINFEEKLGIPINLGDLFIDLNQVLRQAHEYDHSYERELGYVCVHGFLHLNGFNHIKQEDENIMIPLQKKILNAYGLTR